MRDNQIALKGEEHCLFLKPKLDLGTISIDRASNVRIPFRNLSLPIMSSESDKFCGSEMFKAITQDSKLFGNDAFDDRSYTPWRMT